MKLKSKLEKNEDHGLLDNMNSFFNEPLNFSRGGKHSKAEALKKMSEARKKIESAIAGQCTPDVEGQWKKICELYARNIVPELDYAEHWLNDRTDEDREILKFFSLSTN